jgi:hypothetical protein
MVFILEGIAVTKRLSMACLLVAWMILIVACSAQAAEEILKLVPVTASGFLLINHPAAVDAKIQALGQQMQLPAPSPLMLLKAQLGIQQGMDENGTMGIITLPPDEEGAMPTPIILIPVTDYGKFIGQLKPEGGQAAVVKVELMRTAFWVRNIGGYAALTDAAHKEVLEKTLKVAAKTPAALAPWQQWLGENDVAAVILPPGIKRICAKAQQWIGDTKRLMAQVGGQDQSAAAGFDVYASILKNAETAVTAFAFGLQVDKQNTIRATSRTRLAAGEKWSRLVPQNQSANGELFKGLPDEPFVFACGGLPSQAIMDEAMKFSMNLMKSMPDVYGLSEEQVEKIMKLSTRPLKDVRCMSMAMGVCGGDEPLYSKATAVMQVGDSQEFMANYEKYMREYGDILKENPDSLFHPPTIERVEFGGVAGLQLTMEIPTPPGAAQRPQQAKTMEAMFGPGGKITTFLAPAGEHTVVMGYVSKEHMQKAIDSIKQGKPDLAGNPTVSKTAGMLPRDAVLAAYISPQGATGFIRRMATVAIPPAIGAVPQIPEFPATPPIGFALTATADELQTCLVVPAEVLSAVPTYISTIRSQSNR